MYRLRALGGLTLERGGTALDEMAAHRKALALLAILAVQGGTSRDRLMALLWPDADEARARNSLKQTVHLIRRRLGAPDVVLGVTELRLNPGRVESDVDAFATALRQGDTRAAVALYGGPFLDGVHVDGAGDLERWVEERRTELGRQYMDGVERLAVDAEGAGDPVEAASWWRRLQAADPLNGRIAVRVMLALEAAGDRVGALRHAAVHAALVRDELGMAPDPAVPELAEELRQRPPRPAAGHPAVPATGRLHPEVLPTFPSAAHPAPGSLRPVLLAAAVLVVAVVAALLATTAGRAPTGPAGGGDSSGTPASPAIRESIAVLPFVDLSAGRDQEHFSDGITDELITALSSVEWLKVAARTSAFQFKADRPDVREVASRLHVAHVLEGSVRKDGTRLRISAQLVDAAAGYQLWAESYDRDVSDVFGVQKEIAHAIVDALRERLGAPLAGGMPPGGSTEDVAAYEQYLKGLFFFNRLQLPRAIEGFTAAITLDPGFARAHAALAEAYAIPAAYGEGSPGEDYGRALAAAEAALRIDPHLADGHAALGWLQMIGLRWDDAGRSLRRAIELDPRLPRARLYHALYLHRRGSPEAALVELEHARVTDPLALPVNAIYGSVLADLGRVDDGLDALHAALELDPAHPIAHAVLAHALLGEGRYEEAIGHYEAAASVVPSSYYAGFLGHAYARAGRTSDARFVLGQLEARARGGAHVSPAAMGLILLGIGEDDEAYRRLGEAARQRDVFLTVYGVLSNGPLSGPYIGDKRFQELRASVGLTPRP
jgi:adenylate cyclase